VSKKQTTFSGSEIPSSLSIFDVLAPESRLRQHLEETFRDCTRTADDLRPEQLQAIEFAWANPFSALFLDVGFGKTAIILNVIARLLQRGYKHKILIIAPIRVATQVWPHETRLWLNLAHLRMTVIRVEDGQISGSKDRTARKLAMRRALLDSPDPIHVINQEAVSWLVEERGKNWPYRVVVFDESSRLRDHRSVVFKALARVRPAVARFHQLTATPSSQTYMHLFSQIFLLDRGERFSRFITHFREAYFNYNIYTMKWTLREGAAEEIERRIADICLVMRRQRDFQISIRPIRLPDSMMRQYSQFERQLVLELPDETIDAINGAVLCGKLLQYASGVIYDAERRSHELHEEKVAELRSLVEETLEEPVLVAYWFRSTLRRLKEAFPDAAVMDREGDVVTAWNQRKYKMMLIHPQSAGHGLNLQHGGHHLVIFDLFYSLELFLQLIGRLDRPGQTSTVMVHLLAATGTIDETVAANLQKLRRVEDQMFRRLQELRSGGHVRCV
jgi:hypothetical protein